MQAILSQFESEIVDLKNRMAAQEIETQKANSKFEFNVSEQEKLKKNFESEKKIWADEKAALVTRAEQAEKALAEKTAELSGLKRQVSQMVAAIFGKSPRRLSLSLYMSWFILVIGLSDLVKQVPGVPTSTRAWSPS